MLLQFAVENFLSIKEQVVLSMLVPPDAKPDGRHVTTVGGQWGVLRCAAVYGANAAGKSNLVRALDVLRELVLRGTTGDARMNVTGFRLDRSWTTRPTRFEVELVLDGARYSYGLEATSKAVVSEWLYRTQGDAEELLFEREAPADDSPEHQFRFGEQVAAGDEQRQFLRFVAKGTRPNQPFLAECQQRNVTEFVAVIRWFHEGLTIILPHSTHRTLVSDLEDESARVFIEQRLRGWGTGVEGIDIRRGKHTRRWLGAVLSLLPEDEPTNFSFEGDDVTSKRIGFRHTGAPDGESFDWTSESDGTRRLMHLLPTLYQVHQKAGPSRLFVVDELERSLHATLTRRFVEEFLDLCVDQGDGGGQLIFTTHDTNLLNGRLLPPASIWFVEKDHLGATHLSSLAEYPTEQVEKLTDRLEDGYLQGRFGAIPFVASREQLAWCPPKTGT